MSRNSPAGVNHPRYAVRMSLAAKRGAAEPASVDPDHRQLRGSPALGIEAGEGDALAVRRERAPRPGHVETPVQAAAQEDRRRGVSRARRPVPGVVDDGRYREGAGAGRDHPVAAERRRLVAVRPAPLAADLMERSAHRAAPELVGLSVRARRDDDLFHDRLATEPQAEHRRVESILAAEPEALEQLRPRAAVHHADVARCSRGDPRARGGERRRLVGDAEERGREAGRGCARPRPLPRPRPRRPT